MRWLKPSIRSIYGLLGNPPAHTDSVLEDGIEDIRELMLDALGEQGSRQFPQITRHIRYADGNQSLWYLRGELMVTLATMHGEVVARRKSAGGAARGRGRRPG